MQLTSSAPAPDSPIIRTGSDGRLRYSPEQRQTLLDAFMPQVCPLLPPAYFAAGWKPRDYQPAVEGPDGEAAPR